MRRVLTALLVVALPAAPIRAQAPASISDSAFVRLIGALSEAPGYFDTDNLISNEDSFLLPITTLRKLGVTGGAYLGVGPDQNFSYIAAIRPRIAFIVDIRRDNLLQHLLFKAAFSLSRNRIEFLCLLFGKPAPADTAEWNGRDIASLLAYIDRTRSNEVERAVSRVDAAVKKMGFALMPNDLATIERFHRTFITEGPSLRFNSHGRAPQPYYPDYRRLMTEKDRTGRQSNYLAHESDFQFVKSMEARNLIVPVVGDFGGAKALPAIADWLRTNRETVSAFYTSNVEQYLFRDRTFARFAQSVVQLPRSTSSVMIRSYFEGRVLNPVPGYHVIMLTQLMDRFAAAQTSGTLSSYFALVTNDVIDQ